MIFKTKEKDTPFKWYPDVMSMAPRSTLSQLQHIVAYKIKCVDRSTEWQVDYSGGQLF